MITDETDQLFVLVSNPRYLSARAGAIIAGKVVKEDVLHGRYAKNQIVGFRKRPDGLVSKTRQGETYRLASTEVLSALVLL